MTFLVAAEGEAPAAAGSELKFVLHEAPFPYPSWDAAMDALLENREAEVTVKRAWTLVDEVVNGVPVNWAFTPESHPAHPSVVRRTPIQKDGEVVVELMYRCDARDRAACTGLLAEFRDLNDGMVVEFKRRLGLLEHPRKAEALEVAERYIDSVEEGRDEESLALLTSYSRSGYTLAAWRLLREKHRAGKGGTLTMRRLRSLDWFENPPGVELEGTFAFMEFESKYDTGSGTGRDDMQRVILHSDKGAPFRVMLDEAPFLRLVKIRRAQ